VPPAAGSDARPGLAIPRDDIVEVHRSLRALLRRLRDERLTVMERRVLDGVIELTVTWCRLSDRVTVGQVADAAGIERERTVREILARLADRGLIVWIPTRGRPGRTGTRGSLVGLVPASDEGTVAPTDSAEIRRCNAGTAPESAPQPRESDEVIRRPDADVAPDYRENEPIIRRSGRADGREIRRLTCSAAPPPKKGSSLREEPPPAPARETRAGGGGNPTEQPNHTSAAPTPADAASEVLAGLARPLAIPAGSLRSQHARVTAVLAAGEWDPDALRRHLLEDLPFPIRHPPALIGRRLENTILPAGPSACPCRACSRTTAAARQSAARRAQATDAATRTPAAPVDPERLRARLAAEDAADPHDAALGALAAALGPDRHTAVLRRLSPFPRRALDDPVTAAAIRPLLVARAQAYGWNPEAIAAAILGDPDPTPETSRPRLTSSVSPASNTT
jgi:hypothetical protein